MKFSIKIISILIFLSLIGTNSIKAQASHIHIKDMVLMPDEDIHVNDTINNYYKLVVKIDSASIGNRIFLQFGTGVNQGNVLSTQGFFQGSGNNYGINYNNTVYPITKFSIIIPVVINKVTVNTISFLTVYIEDTSNLISNKLYYSFNP